jgi:hypothetical protein
MAPRLNDTGEISAFEVFVTFEPLFQPVHQGVFLGIVALSLLLYFIVRSLLYLFYVHQSGLDIYQ